MNEFWQYAPTSVPVQTLTSLSLSVADSFLVGLETSSLSHQLLPNFALRNLAGFADRACSVEPAQTQTRDSRVKPIMPHGMIFALMHKGARAAECGSKMLCLLCREATCI